MVYKHHLMTSGSLFDAISIKKTKEKKSKKLQKFKVGINISVILLFLHQNASQFIVNFLKQSPRLILLLYFKRVFRYYECEKSKSIY